MTQLPETNVKMTELLETNVQSNVQNLEMYELLSSIGCCKMCSLRFFGETKVEAYKFLYSLGFGPGRHIKTEVNEDAPNGVKKLASNPCIACLGVLQPPICDKIIDEIVAAVEKEEYDNPTFNIAFSIPVSFYLRAHAVLVFLLDSHPDHVKEHLPMRLVTIGVKDAWKYAFADKVAQRINKKFDVDSDLRIQVDIQYEDDHSEIDCLLKMRPDIFKDQRIKAKRLRHCAGPMLLYSRKAVEVTLGTTDRQCFSKHFPVPPTIPTHSAVCNTVMFEQAPLYLGGRYNKYTRSLPQTAWMVKDERRMETSVHELIAGKVQALTKAQGSKLISSGREDVDVRMLGDGRPFALELAAPRHVLLSSEQLGQLEADINQEGGGRISVHNLKLVSKSAMELLKQGEETKTKTYTAYCIAWDTDAATVAALTTETPLVLQQKTPVRVLHRRPIATRPRTVHWMKVSNVTCVDNKTYFRLQLNTQAGTYIKEFVHGDFGRTKPSVGELLGGVTADCLALDVESIELQWPL
ncbi:tRNA pseudouridine synthase Pus10 [Macrosteles quadrilineatus]|uniref:tRNA pseudouridine synthase Pus10 n=1 Tax=Macrosteles quadrilineatus TaxID=74068 RepID=UPI0023E2F77E|nr:tRNA pseudouridine synthase Pus10 [Macrosteles quadrilineatus]